MKTIPCIRTDAERPPRRSHRAHLALEHVTRKLGEGVASVLLCIDDADGELIVSTTCSLTHDEQGAFRDAWRAITGEASSVDFLSPESPRSDRAWLLEEIAYAAMAKTDARNHAAH